VVRRKTTNKKKNNNIYNYKKWIYASFLLFFWVMALIMDSKSFIGSYYLNFLFDLFWEYYKWIFAPVTILFSFILFKDKEVEFDLFRIIGLLFYYVSLTTIIWFFSSSYTAILNLDPVLNNLIWSLAVFFTSFLLFIFSLVILFSFSPIKFLQLLTSVTPKIGNLKNTLKVQEKDGIKKSSRNIEVKKVDKEKEKLEKMLEELKKEKEKKFQ